MLWQFLFKNGSFAENEMDDLLYICHTEYSATRDCLLELGISPNSIILVAEREHWLVHHRTVKNLAKFSYPLQCTAYSDHNKSLLSFKNGEVFYFLFSLRITQCFQTSGLLLDTGAKMEVKRVRDVFCLTRSALGHCRYLCVCVSVEHILTKKKKELYCG